MEPLILSFLLHNHGIPKSITDWTKWHCNSSELYWKVDPFWKTYFKRDGDFTFPKTYLYGSNRSCSLNYLNNWFLYSTSNDSVFYIHCALFSQENRKNLNTFVIIGLNDCHNIIERESIHVERKYNKDAIVKITITLLIVLANQKEPFNITHIPLAVTGVIHIQKF